MPDFKSWYSDIAKKNRLHPDPNNFRHFYNYKEAYETGANTDKSGHFPSSSKTAGHPRMFVNGINTKTGKPAKPGEIERNDEYRRRLEQWGGTQMWRR